MDRFVKILKQTSDKILVGGYGVIFGGEDLVGETFTKDTDLMLDLVPVKGIFYDHGEREDIEHLIGKSVNEILREAGVWVEAELERHKEYVDEIANLIEEKALGWSSQAVYSLVRYDDDWKTIKRWPIVEYSLTPTPAEPRTLGVERIKSIAEVNPKLKALLLQSPGEGLNAEADPSGRSLIEQTQLRARAYLALD